MAKKYLITLQDDTVTELEKYLTWKKNLVWENAGIIINPTPTGTLTQIVTEFFKNLKYSDK